ncbi:MAG: PKD domain-containing protein [Salinibacter sp.]|uniref:PKD domain-containing protein n=1 Tax=Salinibacter sp. TaxID=2065818 RepID=UPI0035D451E5
MSRLTLTHAKRRPIRYGRGQFLAGGSCFSGRIRPLLVVLYTLLLGGFMAGMSARAQEPAQAQKKRAGDTFYLKAGVGLSDYAGDADGQSDVDDVTDDYDFIFDAQKFTDGDVFPYTLSGELGYQISPALGASLGYRFGQYPFVSGVPFTVDPDLTGEGGDLGTVRHTIQLLGRYTLKAEDWTAAPYLDAGLGVSLGGNTPGLGPSIGVGVDVLLSSRTSLFLESRSSFILDDAAADGIDTETPVDALSKALSLGVKYNLSRRTPPRIRVLNCPEEVRATKSFTLTARVNGEEVYRPVEYQWRLGDGETASGLTVSHTYSQPGTYEVTFTARNDAGRARQSCTVNATPAPQPAVIASIDATPNPVDECGTVRFSSTVEGDRPITYNWTFSDGTKASGESTTRTYEEPGEYTVRLDASNDVGKDTDTVAVRVNQPPAVCTTIGEMNTVFFEQNSSTLTEEAKKSLSENADVLSKCPKLNVQVKGFAAPDERNPQSLSADRARAVASFYQDSGVSEARISTSGEGEVEGVTTKKGDTQQNRRVDSVPVQDGECDM